MTNYKYPNPLPLLPEQCVTAQKMVDYIEGEREIDIRTVAAKVAPTVTEWTGKTHSGPEDPPTNLTGYGEAVVRELKEMLKYEAPHNQCIGEYRVIGMEWMEFIWYVRNCVHYFYHPEDDPNNQDDDEEDQVPEEPAFNEEQAFQRVWSMCMKCLNTNSEVGKQLNEDVESIHVLDTIIATGLKSDDEVYAMYTQLSDEKRTELHDKLFVQFARLRPTVSLEQLHQLRTLSFEQFTQDEAFKTLQSQELDIDNKVKRAKGLYFKTIGKSTGLSDNLRKLTKFQKSWLVEQLEKMLQDQFAKRPVEMTVEKVTLPDIQKIQENYELHKEQLIEVNEKSESKESVVERESKEDITPVETVEIVMPDGKTLQSSVFSVERQTSLPVTPPLPPRVDRPSPERSIETFESPSLPVQRVPSPLPVAGVPPPQSVGSTVAGVPPPQSVGSTVAEEVPTAAQAAFQEWVNQRQTLLDMRESLPSTFDYSQMTVALKRCSTTATSAVTTAEAVFDSPAPGEETQESSSRKRQRTESFDD